MTTGSRKKDGVICLISYKDHILHISIMSRGNYRERALRMLALDREFLPALQRAVRMSDIGAVLVSRGALGGFASSRLILATVNTWAWLANVPVSEVKLSDARGRADRERTIRAAVNRRTQFIHQLEPRYATPPDITPSRRRPGFVITPSSDHASS